MTTRNAVHSLLVIDDFDDLPAVIAGLFPGHHVMGSASAREGFRCAKARAFDLYIVDFNLPDLPGDELCRVLRTIDANAPILVYSGMPAPVRSGNEAWTAWREKNGDIHALVECVERLLHEQRLINEAATDAELAAIAQDLEDQAAARQARDAELAARTQELGERIRSAWQKHCNHEILSKALSAYTTSGGTPASFSRFWGEATEIVGMPQAGGLAS